MSDKELVEKSINWFKQIAADIDCITTGNLSQCAPIVKGEAIRAYEFLEKHKEKN